MNKSTKERPAAVPNGETGTKHETSADHTHVAWGNEKIAIANLPPHAVHYLIQYGMNQSRQDAVAGLKKEHATKGVGEQESAAEFARAWQERLSRIMDGTISTRVIGPRKSGIEKYMNDVAVDRIRAVCSKPNKKTGLKTKMPTGKELAQYVSQLIAAQGPSIRASAELRMQEAEQGDFDLGA